MPLRFAVKVKLIAQHAINIRGKNKKKERFVKHAKEKRSN
jgi:hypothetical protein